VIEIKLLKKKEVVKRSNILFILSIVIYKHNTYCLWTSFSYAKKWVELLKIWFKTNTIQGAKDKVKERHKYFKST
jgi:hypothetical protein